MHKELDAATRALSHDARFLPQNILGENEMGDDLRPLMNDAAFHHRFHEAQSFQEFLNSASISQELWPAFASLERLRYHLLGSMLYRGTRKGLRLYRDQNPYFKSGDTSRITQATAALADFLEQGTLNTLFSMLPAEALTHLQALPKCLHHQADFLSKLHEVLRCLIGISGVQSPSKDQKPSTLTEASGTQIKEEGKESISTDDPEEQISLGEEILNINTPETMKLGEEELQATTFLSSLPQGVDFFEERKRLWSTNQYRIFRAHHDQIVGIEHLTTREERQRYRRVLDEKAHAFQDNIRPLALKLSRFLKSQSPQRWSFEEEEGFINGARVAQRIMNPSYAYAYKKLIEEETPDTSVTLLIDNSGSMRGRPIQLAALSVDFLAQTLERCDVNLEILGFTTRAWKGGQSYQDWIQAGRPPSPGRLNDVCHIVYKSFDTTWRTARPRIGGMLKEGLLKENIDGEALLWAAKRLLSTRGRKKILIIISDGAPVDDMTLAHNQTRILEQHLAFVIERLHHHPGLSLFAIGIGHDVTRMYPNAMTLKSADDLGKTLFEGLPTLLKKAKGGRGVRKI